MFRNILNNLIIIIPSILSIVLVSLLWNLIEFKYQNLEEIVGYYSIFKHSLLNDNLRFIFFIGVPLMTCFITFLFKKKISFVLIKEKLILNKNNSNNNKIPIIYLFCLFFLLIILFLSSEFNENKIDLFHEGQALSGGLNYELKNQLWSGTFVVTSLFFDILSPKIAWEIFDIQSIGSYRIFVFFLYQLASLVIFIFLFSFCNKLNLNKN